MIPFMKSGGTPVVSVVRMNGVIGPSSLARGGLNLASVSEALEQAFGFKKAKAVALLINSPGGSPTQSTLIYKRVRALAKENEKPVFAFTEDAAASGGYMIACAADEIFADPSSVVGSIGVISAGFGFTGLIEKLGIERRVHTAGEKKMTLDPFQPEEPADVERLLDLQRDIHVFFKSLVRESRGDRLPADAEETLFTGEFWTGNQAQHLGLVDGLGDLRTTMRERYGDKVKFKVFGGKKSFWQKREGIHQGGGLADLPGSLARDLICELEQRAYWSRLGL